MAQIKSASAKNSIRNMLLTQGNVAASDSTGNTLRHQDKQASQAAAIAARRRDLGTGIPVTTVHRKSTH